MISVQDALGFIMFTPDEERAIAKLEAAIDASIADPKKFYGNVLTLQFNEEISPKVAHAVRRKYESGEGHWRVAVEQRASHLAEEPFPFTRFQLVPMFFTGPAKPKSETKQLPPVATVIPWAPIPLGALTDVTKRLLVRMPTRSRPAQALEVLEKYRRMPGVPVTIEVVLDDDDASMMAADVLQRLVALDCRLTIGRHRSKVEACNAGRISNWDVLLLASDDMVPVKDGYGARILAAMEEHWPHLDGALHFNDGHQGSNLYTLPVLGRRLYEQFDGVYDDAYTSLFCDTEQTAILRGLGRLTYVDEVIIEHCHHVWGTACKARTPTNDPLYVRNDALWNIDQAVYETRRQSTLPHAQMPWKSPPLWLSVCIAALPQRRRMLDQLLAYLWEQIIYGVTTVNVNRVRSSPRSVEVLVDATAGITIGEKRQRLIERAKGHFVAFVDDDDWIAHDYVPRVVTALEQHPDADCASLVGVMTTAGAVPEVFHHALANGVWSTSGGIHRRTPNHLNAIRRELALQVGFPSQSHGEDFDFSKRLKPLLKTEASTGEAPLYYYFYQPTKEPAA